MYSRKTQASPTKYAKAIGYNYKPLAFKLRQELKKLKDRDLSILALGDVYKKVI